MGEELFWRGKDKTYVTKKGAEEYNKQSGRCVEREVEGES